MPTGANGSSSAAVRRRRMVVCVWVRRAALTTVTSLSGAALAGTRTSEEVREGAAAVGVLPVMVGAGVVPGGVVVVDGVVLADVDVLVVVVGVIESGGASGDGVSGNGAACSAFAGRRVGPSVGRSRRRARFVESNPVVPAPKAGGLPNPIAGRSPTFWRSGAGGAGLRLRRAASSLSSSAGRNSVPGDGRSVVCPKA